MAGYAASAMLQGAPPRFAGANPRVAANAGTRSGSLDLPALEGAWITDPIELVGRPINEVIGDWLASVGEAWSQLTFFLFDPDSWR